MSEFLQLARDIARDSGNPPREDYEAFKITEPSGKTYRVFADGHAEGFQPGAVICNYIPSLLMSAKSKEPG